MKICLYRAFPDAYRQSMTLYADELIKGIRPLLKNGDTLEDYIPKFIRTNPALLRYFSQYALYQYAASRIEADIHHITDHSYAHLLHSLPSSRTVITFHDAIGLENSIGFGREILRRCNLSALKKAGALIFDSQASRSALLKSICYPEERTFVIYPGLDPVFFKSTGEDPFTALGIPQNLYMLHVGHTGEYKNIPALFHVLSALKKMGIPIKLLKTGTPFTPAQNNLAKNLHVTPDILHLGLIKKEQMPLVYRSSQFLLFPSFNEGFGFPVLEAMASGIPVISSNRGSLPELAPDRDGLFDPEDYPGMSRRGAELIQHSSLRNSLIKEGLRKAGDFQWGNTAKQILSVYQHL